jgi:2-amino-4-hydroxy-6-hydroxymethyldihydropteridine diphosphokinase
MPMTGVYVAAGSNVRAREHLRRAIEELKKTFPGLRVSRAYRNAAVGFEGEDFINLVVGFDTSAGLPQVIEELRRIEALCGRARDAPKWAPRSMDLDILLFGDLVATLPEATLPRPDLLKRPYMLGPLADVAPELRHPVAHRSIGELWADFDRGAHAMHIVDLDADVPAKGGRMSEGCPLSGFSMLDPAVQSCPDEFYAALHARGAVYQMPETGAFVIVGFDALSAVLRDTDSFSSDIGDNYFQIQGEEGARLYKRVLQEGGWDHVKTLQRTDPPLHARYRRLVDRVFSIPAVKALTPHIEETCHRLIDGFIGRGECEFVAEFALPLPGIIIAEQLGLDTERLPTLKRWADALLDSACRPMPPDELRRTAETEVELQHHLAAVFEERRRAPRADLISRLVYERVEGDEPLSMHELQNIMHQLISGGFDTTTSAIAHGLWLLLRHPDQMAKLRANPALRRGFIDEALRLESPVQGLMRRATREVQIDGVTIPAGAHVIVRYAAANQDPRKFDRPRKFDIERANAGQSLAFGNGVHFCVGRLLARQELDSAFAILLSRLDDISLARALPEPAHHPSIFLHPLKELPIRFKPGARQA